MLAFYMLKEVKQLHLNGQSPKDTYVMRGIIMNYLLTGLGLTDFLKDPVTVRSTTPDGTQNYKIIYCSNPHIEKHRHFEGQILLLNSGRICSNVLEIVANQN